MDERLKALSVLGSTGSVGTQVLDIVRTYPDRFGVVGLSANRNHQLLSDQIAEFKPRFVHYTDPLEEGIDFPASDVHKATLSEIATADDVDIVVTATTGDVALSPTFDAIEKGIDVAIANKETIIMAGAKLMRHARNKSVSLLPVDSEPSAIWQCLRGENSSIEKLVITASGGAFRDVRIEELDLVQRTDALKHPTWKMGAKISVDSATMMNKAFEVIEAKWLFNVDWNRIDVVIHPESIIHSMVEFEDGSTKAQLSPPDMRLPIQYALFYPERLPNMKLTRFDPIKTKELTFRELDHDRYPCFQMALDHAKKGGTWPSALCGADDGAVEAFLDGKISFREIEPLIRTSLLAHESVANPSLEQMQEASKWGKNQVKTLVNITGNHD
ncbi:MAG: 1-deoxy-D-xylulose-5-phosphate reductoisomerase [Chloroflexota bacterium]|nr:1-deoxy-D-xylulose-5-phosphate reductoisomerase [Chloroflexota bacterium]